MIIFRFLIVIWCETSVWWGWCDWHGPGVRWWRRRRLVVVKSLNIIFVTDPSQVLQDLLLQEIDYIR